MSDKKTIQEKLIGKHPKKGTPFGNWLVHEDYAENETQIIRNFTELDAEDDNAKQQIAQWIITHHIDSQKISRLKRKKEILTKYNFKRFLKSQNTLPVSDKTKKGNIAEIILAEYLQSSSTLSLLIFRLRFNPNVDQSMKGDDVLLFNPQNLKEKILLGEAKYRSKPNKQVIEDLVNFSDNAKTPLSITFIANVLSSMGEEQLASKLEDLNSELHLGKIPIIKIGFLFSNSNAFENMKQHLSSKNQKFLSLAINLKDPDTFVKDSYEFAQDILSNMKIPKY